MAAEMPVLAVNSTLAGAAQGSSRFGGLGAIASGGELSRVNAELEERVTARTDELRQAKTASETVIASVAEGM